MKRICISILIGLFVLYSCKTSGTKEQQNMAIEIYETLPQFQVPKIILEELEQLYVVLNTDTLSPIIAYIHVDSTVILPAIEQGNIKLLRTSIAVDSNKQYITIVAVNYPPSINASDIKTTKTVENNLNIFFNIEGAKKWADLTKNNIGNLIAFLVDDEICTLTLVNGEIRNGEAVIIGFENIK